MSAFDPLQILAPRETFTWMRAFTLALAALITSGCSNRTPPSAYQHVKDQFWAATALRQPCVRTINRELSLLAIRDCYRFDKPERMRGVAVTGFETGSFYPRRSTLPPTPEQSNLWPELDTAALPRNVQNKCAEGCTVYLEFIGRRTAVEGAYGHAGLSKHIILVDRVLAADVLD